MTLRLAFAALALALLAACASNPPSERRAQRLAEFLRYAGEPVDEVRTFELNRFEVVGPNELVVWTRVSEAYLLTVQQHCPDLVWAQTIGITTTLNTVQRKFDSVLTGRIPCRIVAIRPIDYRRMRADERAQS